MKINIVFFVLLILLSSCGRAQYVRDSEAPDIDDYALSLRFDRRDLDRLYLDNIDKMMNSKIANQWETQSGPSPTVAIFPMRNETSEHIDNALETLLSKFETDIVNQSRADVVSHENQVDLIAEVRRQQQDAYDPKRLARYGKQLGAQYFITGKVFDETDFAGDERRVQYTMFVQIINVETGKVEWQNESALTKAFLR